jgi:uncharacterized membrane protein
MIFLKIIAWWFGVTIFLLAVLCAKALYAEKRELQTASKEPERKNKAVQSNPLNSALGASLELDCGAPNLPQMPQTFAERAQSAAAGRAMM